MGQPVGQKQHSYRLPRVIEPTRISGGSPETSDHKHVLRSVDYDGHDLLEIGLGAQLHAWIAYRFLLHGNGPTGLRKDATIFGMDPDQRYQAFRGRAFPGFSPNELAAELMSGSYSLKDGVIVSMDGDVAGFLVAVPERVTAGVVGLGPPSRLDRVSHSFQLAGRALDAARVFGGSPGIRGFRDMGLLSTIQLDSDVGETLRRRYIQPLQEADSPDELLNMVQAYFACQMHVDQAAAAQRVHPNTLRNWLAVFKSVTGANLNDMAVAMEAWWALKYDALAKTRDVPKHQSPSSPAGRGSTGRTGSDAASGRAYAAVTAQPRTERLPDRGSASTIRPLDGDHAPESSEGVRAAFVRGLLWGTLGPDEVRRGIDEYALRADCEYRAVRGIPDATGAPGALARALGFASGEAECGGLVAVVNGEVVGFRATAADGDLPGVVGVGEPRRLSRMPESFRMASRALEIASRRGQTGWLRFAQFGLLPAFLAETSVGEALYHRYLGPLGANHFAAEITDTLRVYLREGMRRDRTAKRMFIHPNTVGYRISRFEKLADVSLRNNPTVAFELLWALEYQTCLPKPETGDTE